MASFKLVDESVPPGEYRAKFLGVKPYESQYGDSLRFGFQIVGGESDGAIASRICSARPTTRNATGRILCSIAGQKPGANLEINPDEFIGKEYIVEVEPTQNGNSTRVEVVKALSDATPF